MILRLTLLAVIALAASCKTYTITPENLRNQLINDNVIKLENVKINNPLLPFENIRYQANNIKFITVNDKAGGIFTLPNSPAIEMRVTLKNKSRKIFYFDTVTLENDTLKGNKSRFLGLTNNIPFNEIIKIELQDGGKKFYPVKPTKNEIISKTSEKTYANKGEVLEHSIFKMDTISIQVDKFNNLYYAKCNFEQSKSEVTFIYYINNNFLELIRAREISPYEQNNIWWVNTFYVENDTIFFEEKFCSTNKKDENFKLGKYKDYKFNKNLNTKFLKKFSLEVYNKIKTST